MRPLLTINAYGSVIDNSRKNYAGNYTGAMGPIGPTGPTGPTGPIGGAFISASIPAIATNSTSGASLVWNGSGAGWISSYISGATAASGYGKSLTHVNPSTSVSVGPKYISILGGSFYKDQPDDYPKYRNIISGSFINK